MANKDKTKEEQIRELAAAGKIKYESSFEIEDYEEIAREFLAEIFDIDYDECFISDKSSLWDFAGCCVPADYDRDLSYNDICKLGEENMIKTINEQYGLDVKVNDYLITVFEQLRQQRIARLN